MIVHNNVSQGIKRKADEAGSVSAPVTPAMVTPASSAPALTDQVNTTF